MTPAVVPRHAVGPAAEAARVASQAAVRAVVPHAEGAAPHAGLEAVPREAPAAVRCAGLAAAPGVEPAAQPCSGWVAERSVPQVEMVVRRAAPQVLTLAFEVQQKEVERPALKERMEGASMQAAGQALAEP